MKGKLFVSNLFVESGDTQPDNDLIYFKNLKYPLKRILPYFFDNGKEILDVTTGRKKSWDDDLYSSESLIDGKPFCNVVFCDGSPNSDADIICDFRRLPFPDNYFDIIFFDPAFTEVKNAQEAFGNRNKKANRQFYFRGIGDKWIPPEAYFFQTWREFNRVTKNGLIVKISERFKDLEEIPVLTYLDLAYNKRFNHKSDFIRVAKIDYRGKRMATGARTANPQRVLSQYCIFKKNRRMR